jgi:hypothetical protein
LWRDQLATQQPTQTMEPTDRGGNSLDEIFQSRHSTSTHRATPCVVIPLKCVHELVSLKLSGYNLFELTSVRRERKEGECVLKVLPGHVVHVGQVSNTSGRQVPVMISLRVLCILTGNLSSSRQNFLKLKYA